MQILIPMTGYGSRFAAAGYKELKPFIKVYGFPIIEWIVKGIFYAEKDIIFICRKEHVDTIDYMADTLKGICPSARIIEIDNWVKKGPVYDVMRVSCEIDNDKPAIINYCDFYMTWNYQEFKSKVVKHKYDGAIPCYTGFHPSLIPVKNVYASCLYDNEYNLLEIREKYSFEKDKTKASHSGGTYYFNSGETLKKYCQQLIDEKTELNGEYYASLPYNNMVRDGLRIWVANIIDYFCQWGTPEDLQDFLFWNNYIRSWKK